MEAFLDLPPLAKRRARFFVSRLTMYIAVVMLQFVLRPSIDSGLTPFLPAQPTAIPVMHILLIAMRGAMLITNMELSRSNWSPRR